MAFSFMEIQEPERLAASATPPGQPLFRYKWSSGAFIDRKVVCDYRKFGFLTVFQFNNYRPFSTEFRRGYYVYVGSAMKNLTQRIERHRRLRKNFFWHIDYLRDVCEFLAALPVRSEDDLECLIAAGVDAIADWTVPGFGSSDCSCPSHLFGFENHPLNLPPFHDLLQHFRMERLIDKYSSPSLPQL